MIYTRNAEEKRKIEKDKKAEREKSSWSEDQKTREYYYDDAHGYEVYKPHNDENEDSNNE